MRPQLHDMIDLLQAADFNCLENTFPLVEKTRQHALVSRREVHVRAAVGDKRPSSDTSIKSGRKLCSSVPWWMQVQTKYFSIMRFTMTFLCHLHVP